MPLINEQWVLAKRNQFKSRSCKRMIYALVFGRKRERDREREREREIEDFDSIRICVENCN